MKFADLVKSDVCRYLDKLGVEPSFSVLPVIRALIFCPGLQLAILIRLQAVIGSFPLVGRFLRRALSYFISIYFSCDIDPNATFGPGIYFPHANGIVIGGEWDVGANVTILHRVTLGRHDIPNGRSVIGDNVFIGSGACVIGSLEIGEGAKIGSNAVVIKNIPPFATAVGVPARILN